MTLDNDASDSGQTDACTFKPIFDSLKHWPPEFQQLAKTAQGLGTTIAFSGDSAHAFSRKDVNGIEATRRIKRSENPPLIIIVTSEGTPSCEALAKAAGADGFVVKGRDLRDQLRLVFQELFRFTEKNHCREKSKSRRPLARG